jgi:hypothetical protein
MKGFLGLTDPIIPSKEPDPIDEYDSLFGVPAELKPQTQTETEIQPP